MTDTHETTADIIAEMRNDASEDEYTPDGILGQTLNSYADRIEAAHKRERGDAAKLREALEAIISGYENADLCDTNYGEWCHEPENPCVNVSLCKAIHESRAALSAPPRNCDIVPIEAPKASDMFHRERPLHGYDYETHDWLLAPATEKEGGAK